MFNLEQSIANWRRQMSAGGIKSTEVLDELESHLREDIEMHLREDMGKQMCADQAMEQAFAQAVDRVGRVVELKLEFGKIERLRPAVSPRLISGGCVAMGVFIVFTGMWILFGAPNAERLLGFAWLMLAGAYVALLPRMNRNFWPGVHGWAIKKAIVTACSLFVLACTAALLLTLIIPHGIAILPNIIFWPLYAAAAATVLVVGFSHNAELAGFWSPAAQQCLQIAHEEAWRFGHDFIGTEHVLLGLLHSEDTPVSKVLGRMGVRRETVRAEIEKTVGTGPLSNAGKALVYTPRAKQAFYLATKEAKALHLAHAEAPHLFLGLLREGSGVAAIVLNKLGVNLENAREEVLKMCR